MHSNRHATHTRTHARTLVAVLNHMLMVATAGHGRCRFTACWPSTANNDMPCLHWSAWRSRTARPCDRVRVGFPLMHVQIACIRIAIDRLKWMIMGMHSLATMFFPPMCWFGCVSWLGKWLNRTCNGSVVRGEAGVELKLGGERTYNSMHGQSVRKLARTCERGCARALKANTRVHASGSDDATSVLNAVNALTCSRVAHRLLTTDVDHVKLRRPPVPNS
jgi:hypothetical protein